MSRPRSTARRPRSASLVWPILLTVPPVILLSVAALYSLRQDRATIDREARERAAVLSADLARRWGARAGTELAALVDSSCSGAVPESPGTPTLAGAEPASARSRASGAGAAPLCGLVIDGRIRVPLDYPSVPSPPEWLRELTPEQARLWRVAASSQTDLATVRRAAATLRGGPPAARVNAEWAVVRTEANRDSSSDATARLTDLARRSAGILSESGAPLPDLALLLALRRLPAGGLPDSLLRDLRQRLVESPSLLTGALVDEAVRVAPGNKEVAGLDARWAANERALALMRRLSIEAERPVETWLDAGQGAWVALVRPLVGNDVVSGAAPRTAFHVTLVPASVIERVFQAAASAGDDVPRYERASLRLGGRTWAARGASSKVARPIELASASGQIDVPLALPADAVSTFAGELTRVASQAIAARQQTPGVVRLNGVPGGHPFTVALELTDPDLLYASYRVRVRIAIGLIVIATLAAFAGLAVAWRAFERQRRLGELKSNFVASVSHELRAPIAAVRLMTENLERGTVPPGERHQDYLRMIGQECRRLSSLVENVLDFSRIDRGRRQYTFEATDLPALLTQTIEVMRPYAGQREVRLVCASLPAAAALKQARVDHHALQQALVNLMDNAIKHSPAGADVVVGLELEPNILRLFVDDRGPGIPADEQERIFEPFYRRGSELRRETQGIGIGLSIVKHVAEAHGGRVVVRSSPGAGSRFAIELPGLGVRSA